MSSIGGRPPALASALLRYIFNQVALGVAINQLDAAGESGFLRTEAAMRLAANSASKPLSVTIMQ